MVSSRTNRTYKEGTIGYIIRQPNPFDPEKSLIMAAGIGRRGTKAAILGLTTFHEKLLFAPIEKVFTRIVQGQDLTGLGEIDDIEVLE